MTRDATVDDATLDTMAAPPEAPRREGELPLVSPSVYEMGAEIARGGMGRIVAAQDRRLRRAVAVKELLRSDAELARRFEIEALITAQLQHPAIVAIYEAGRWPSGEPFYAMKRVNGESFDKVIAKATTLEARLALLPQLLAVFDALAYAHDKRIIHRDLKPHNVLVGAYGETVVIDWGLAKDLGDSSPEVALDLPAGEGTVAGAVMGTPAYMPPEQALGEVVDERADVYACGAMLYQLLTGGPPFTAASTALLLAKVIAESPVPPTGPVDLVAIARKAMAREARDRYPTAKELADELRRYTTGQLVAAHDYSRWELFRRWLRRHRAAVSVGVAAVVVLAVAGVIGVRAIVGERDRAAGAEQQALGELAAARREAGRQLLLEHHPDRAAALLAAAYAARPDDRESAMLASLAVEHAGRELVQLPGGAAVFSPDGSELAIAQYDRIAIVDGVTGAVKRTLAIGGVVTIGYWGDRVLSATPGEVYVDAQILWNDHAEELAAAGDGVVAINGDAVKRIARDGTVAWSVKGRAVHGLVVSADAKHVLAVDDGNVVVWNAATGAREASLEVQDVLVDQATFDPSGTRVVLAQRSTVDVWSIADGKRVATYPLAGEKLVFADPHWVFTGDGAVDVTTGNVRRFTNPSGVIAIAPLGDRRAVTFNSDRVLRIWDLDRGAAPLVAADTDEGLPFNGVASSRGRAAIVYADHVSLWNVEPPPRASWHVGERANELAIAGQRLVVWVDAQGKDTTQIRDLDGTVLATVAGYRPVVRGAQVYARTADDLRVYALGDGALVMTWPHVDALAFDPSGAIALTAEPGKLIWRDSETWLERGHIDVSDDVFSIAVANGRVFAGHSSGKVHVYDLATRRELATLAGHTLEVDAIAVADEVVVTGSYDLTARIWDAHTLRLRAVLDGHPGIVYGVAVSGDQRWIATAAADPQVRIWDAASGDLVESVPVAGNAHHVAFAGTTLFVTTDAGMLERIEIAPRLRTPAEVTAIVAKSAWQLVGTKVLPRESAGNVGAGSGEPGK